MSRGDTGLLTLIRWLQLILLILRELLDAFDDDSPLGEHLENTKNKVLASDDPNSLRRSAGVFVWQLIAYKALESEQRDLDYEASSYAMIDVHDHFGQSCFDPAQLYALLSSRRNVQNGSRLIP